MWLRRERGSYRTPGRAHTCTADEDKDDWEENEDVTAIFIFYFKKEKK